MRTSDMWLISFRLRCRADPTRTAFFIVGVFVLVLLAPLIVLGPIDVTGGAGVFDFETLTSGIYWQVVLSAALLSVVGLLGWWDITRLPGKINRQGLRPLYAIMIYPIAGIVTFTLLLNDDGGSSGGEVLAIVLTLNLFVSLAEEILFRGILFGSLRQKNRLITAIIVSSFCFGAMHLINAGAGQSLPETVFQMINATALGILFCSLVLYGNSLWPAIVLHMVWNTYAMMGVASAEVLGEAPSVMEDLPLLSPWSLILPAFISLIAFGVLHSYRRQTGLRLRDVVPATG